MNDKMKEVACLYDSDEFTSIMIEYGYKNVVQRPKYLNYDPENL